MNNNYRKLKISILLQTLLITVLTGAVGSFILVVFIDGIFNDSFAKAFVQFFEKLNFDEPTARKLYWTLIGNNKTLFIVIGFVILFLLFFYVALSKLKKYLKLIEEGIENILSDSDEPVNLIGELGPIEIKLNEIKMNLKRRQLDAAESEQRKNDLVIFLAHDLKTPLTSIIAYMSMLDEMPDMNEEERKKYIHIALEKSARLCTLINEFFEITRFNLQDIMLEPEKLNLSLLLEQLADELYPVFKEKGLSCSVLIDDVIYVKADPDKLARVFENLLKNAIAYSYPDTRISMNAEVLENKVEITFANQGPVIPPQKLKSIFEKFYRLDDARSSQTGGAGLGLAIAKEIVGLHGGTICAYSDEESTRFVVCLPLLKEKEKTNEAGKRGAK